MLLIVVDIVVSEVVAVVCVDAGKVDGVVFDGFDVVLM